MIPKSGVRVLDDGTRVLWEMSDSVVSLTKLPRRTHGIVKPLVFLGLIYGIYWIVKYKILGW